GASGYSSKLIKRLLLPNASIITNNYDSVARQLGTWLRTSGGTNLDSATYGYDAAGRRTTFTNAGGTYYVYTYDPIGQLRVATSSGTNESRGYLYDNAWNLTVRTNNGTNAFFTVDGKNQLVSLSSASTNQSFTYDGNGNLIAVSNSFTDKIVYGYDDENRL